MVFILHIGKNYPEQQPVSSWEVTLYNDILLYFIICLSTHYSYRLGVGNANAIAYQWESEGDFCELVLPMTSDFWGFNLSCQALGDRSLYLLSHLNNPSVLFFFS